MAAFQDIQPPTPTLEEMSSEYDRLHRDLDGAPDHESKLEVVNRWDKARRRLESWQSLTQLRFQQDTTNAEYKKARDYCDELVPKLTELEVAFKRRLLSAEDRAAFEKALGNQVFSLWETDVTTFIPEIKDDLVREAKLVAKYTELLASAKLQFRGEILNLSEIRRYSESGDRELRHGAELVRWDWYDEHHETLDEIYDDLVRLRTGMARQLGDSSFVDLAYRRLLRTDFDQRDVARFREQVRTHVVPLCQELVKHQAQGLGLSSIAYWDEAVHDPEGNPTPRGEHEWLLDRAQEMFDELGGGLGEFYAMMRHGDLLDLTTRRGKSGGGFCTSFPSYGVPFIFANFNGTKGDVEVFTHEMGHAFQCWMSRNALVYDYLWPTYESCEIHSMSLEFLTWPHMELFFEGDAARFRKIHLFDNLLFLPYGTAVDDFQHRVYESPNASPGERREMWRQVEKEYLPWRDYGDLRYPRRGGVWQAQRHIYQAPFYYIDYTLALTCALQFWVWAAKDRDAALNAYVRLCRRGGEAPFRELTASAGLVSPFDDSCLVEVVSKARQNLGI